MSFLEEVENGVIQSRDLDKLLEEVPITSAEAIKSHVIQTNNSTTEEIIEKNTIVPHNQIVGHQLNSLSPRVFPSLPHTMPQRTTPRSGSRLQDGPFVDYLARSARLQNEPMIKLPRIDTRNAQLRCPFKQIHYSEKQKRLRISRPEAENPDSFSQRQLTLLGNLEKEIRYSTKPKEG
eukprot:TRINITY_DN11970_c0_g1_i1.p1 TRINITY_DN11970_c0_g1~~TRINITY_DN11970_c0_g1_i1.p1  ORF type:complete len:178 (+),score=35.66 TRINITY_DN11970_c0_g1_i1:56-589(+)